MLTLWYDFGTAAMASTSKRSSKVLFRPSQLSPLRMSEMEANLSTASMLFTLPVNRLSTGCYQRRFGTAIPALTWREPPSTPPMRDCQTVPSYSRSMIGPQRGYRLNDSLARTFAFPCCG